LRSLNSHGPAGVQLVVSDADIHPDRRGVATIPGAFPANVLAHVPKESAEMVTAALRTIVAQPDAGPVREQLDTIAGCSGADCPKSRQRCATPARISPPSPISLSRTGKDLKHQPAERLDLHHSTGRQGAAGRRQSARRANRHTGHQGVRRNGLQLTVDRAYLACEAVYADGRPM
jgi:hypothetical protein